MDSRGSSKGEYVNQYEGTFREAPLSVEAGIPSLLDRREDPPGVSRAELQGLLEELDDRPLRQALAAQFGTGLESRGPRKALFRTGATAWRPAVAPFVDGRCLDVNCGFGTRACLLAELVEEVYAVDPSLDALRFLDARDDYGSADDVVPVHGDIESLPPPEEPFDTVVVDATGPNRPEDLEAAVEGLRPAVAPGGTLLVLSDGWPRHSGLTDLLGVGEPAEGASPVGALKTTASATVERFERLGFDAVDLYALLPDAISPTFCFRIDDDDAVAQLLEVELDSTTVRERVVHSVVEWARGTNLLSKSYPAYLTVCRDPSVSATPSEGLVIDGSARSVILDGSEGTLQSVRKLPNRRAHAPYVDTESRVLDTLDTEAGPVAENFPEGTTTTTRLGPMRTEVPVDGDPLVRTVDSNPEAFATVLETGLEWLAAFQRHHRGETKTHDPGAVASALSIPALELSPPPVEEPLSLFETPIHGDYHPKNVFVEDGEITAVIDWELAACSGNPAVDAGFFVLQTASQTFGGLEAGIEKALTTPGAYSDAVDDSLTTYCEAVGLSRRALLAFLPAVWIHRLRTDAERNATMSYTGRAVRRADNVRYVQRRLDDIRRVLG